MKLRKYLIDAIFSLMEQMFDNDRGRKILFSALSQSPFRNEQDRTPVPGNLSIPYDLPFRLNTEPASRKSLIFVTARFRTGSTLLWQLFRSVPGTKCFYEPLNERRWFDSSRRGESVDPTHRGVDEYWKEYEGIERLGDLYNPKWTKRNLWMDENHFDSELLGYLDRLVESTPETVVLQFNRMDFRLGWLRAVYPSSSIVHLYRNPRDQWTSTLGKSNSLMQNLTLSNFRPFDKYYLCNWVRDLQFHFPVLRDCWERHPYIAFFIIWRLSHAYGIAFSDVSLGYEELVSEPRTVFEDVLANLKIDVPQNLDFEGIVVPKPFDRGNTSKDFSDWFAEREYEAESLLQRVT